MRGADSGAGNEHRAPCLLDASQLDAFKLSLTRELALVQGPPGTGKTFVGLQVVRSLLRNVVPRLSARPILVVCYTNHALD
jgi:superfamily II DNA or RNA helicase